jgi:hypothetical protein
MTRTEGLMDIRWMFMLRKNVSHYMVSHPEDRVICGQTYLNDCETYACCRCF